LLQRLLNTHEAVFIWGEHSGFLAPFAEAYYTLACSSRIDDRALPPAAGPPLHQLKRYDRPPAWVNPFGKAEARQAFRECLCALFGASAGRLDGHWGFKEIRYSDGHRVLDFLDEVFPGFWLLFPTRHPKDAVASMMLSWPTNESGSEGLAIPHLEASCDRRLRHWLDVGRYLLDFRDRAPHRTLVIRYEDLCRDTSRIVGVFDTLHLDPPPQDRLKRVIQARLGRTTLAGAQRWSGWSRRASRRPGRRWPRWRVSSATRSS